MGPRILVFGVNDTQKVKLVEEKRDNKVGDEWEIAERSELSASDGNSMAQVDRASTYNDPDKDKQFKQKGSESQTTEGRGDMNSEKIHKSEDNSASKKDVNKD